MDLGFAGFLEVFEKHFGKPATTALLLLLATTIVAVCINLVWDQAVQPLILLFNDMGPTELKEYVRNKLLPTFLSFGVVFLLGNFLAAAIDKHQQRRRAEKILEKLKREAYQQAEQAFSEVQVRGYKMVHDLRARIDDELQSLSSSALEEAWSEIDSAVTAADAKIEAANELEQQLSALFDKLESDPEGAKETLNSFLSAWGQVKAARSSEHAAEAAQD